MFKPRENQVRILQYQRGKMGISAVPGSGKTHTLSCLASLLILKGELQNDQEILIVTLVNSAVDNFLNRIGGFIREAQLLENIGYRVRTLHGLAHDIIQERPDLAGVANQFSIIDEIESERMIAQLSAAYIGLHPEIVSHLQNPEADLSSAGRTRNDFSSLVSKLNQDFISQAKDLQAEPETILNRVQRYNCSDPLIKMGIEVYQQYQRGLRYRNALDFSDLIRLAYTALLNDDGYLQRLRQRWPYILEDEAQDSSNLQEKMLRLLVGPQGNWVRVGDPNQAIYETFTTANPKFLKAFLKEQGVQEMTLPHSGRSNLSIITLANSLVQWTRESHPLPSLRSALDYPLIEPTPPGDPQPNPPDHPSAVYISKMKATADEEIKKVVENILNWLPGNQDKTVAVLTPIGWYGEKMAEALHAAGVPMVELLKSSQSTRRVAGLIEKILLALDDPNSSKKFTEAIQSVWTWDTVEGDKLNEIKSLLPLLKKCSRPEDFFFPQPGKTWREAIEPFEVSEERLQEFEDLRLKFTRWQKASFLPIDQLVLTIANDLFSVPSDLALAHKFALLLEFSTHLHPAYELKDYAQELAVISGNFRKFSGFSDEELLFDPDAHKGKVFISTYHKAKGLEWDRVYLMSVNNYDFPSAQPYDTYIGEKWFIRDNFNPQAEMLSRLTGLLDGDEALIFAPDGQATAAARVDYAAERLRLFFVGITRARQSLVVTWNSGKNKDKTMALPLEALHAIWRGTDEAA